MGCQKKRGPGRRKTGKKAVESAEKQRRILELRKAGYTLDQIADELGYADASGVHHALTRTLERTVGEPAQELRALEADRLDEMWRKVWEKLDRGDVGVVETLIRLQARRAKLLGLDVPTLQRHEIEASLRNATPQETEAAVIEMYRKNPDLWKRIKKEVEG